MLFVQANRSVILGVSFCRVFVFDHAEMCCFLEGVEAFVMRLLFVQVNMARARWFDMPFTREESLTADKKVNLFSE